MNKITALASVFSTALGMVLAQDSVPVLRVTETGLTYVASIDTGVQVTNLWYPHPTDVTNIAVSSMLDVDDVVRRLREQGEVQNLVKMLIKSGDVCSVIDHKWERLPHVTLEYRTDGEYPQHRRCSLCGLSETKHPGIWKRSP